MSGEATTGEEAVRAADGRVPGRRGRRTRRTLLDATARRLETTSYRDLKVVDIARDAGTSPATFYQYFSDVEGAILLLARDLLDEADELTAALEGADWQQDPRGSALALADGFLEFWDEHQHILRVVNLAIVEGDRRFRDIRNDLLAPVTGALQEHIVRERPAGADTDPASEAAVLASMLVHVAEHHPRLQDWGFDVDDLRRSMARIVTATVTGAER